jgi:hypothetical protein
LPRRLSYARVSKRRLRKRVDSVAGRGTMNEEHQALITLLPYDVVITFSALSVFVLASVSFARRLFSRARRTLVVPLLRDRHPIL